MISLAPADKAATVGGTVLEKTDMAIANYPRMRHKRGLSRKEKTGDRVRFRATLDWLQHWWRVYKRPATDSEFARGFLNGYALTGDLMPAPPEMLP